MTRPPARADADPLFPAERARLLRAHADTLEALLVQLARSPDASEALPRPAAVVGHFMNALLAKCIRADGFHTGGELALLQEFFRDGSDMRDNDDWLRDVRAVDHHLAGLKPFLEVARVHDDRHGTSYGVDIRIVATDVAALVVTSDGHTAAGEARFVGELLNDILA